MASAVGVHVWRREADASAIEQELAALWAEIGREQPIARAMMSNLVILRECPRAGELDLTEPPAGLPVDEVAQRHPARILLVHHVRRAPADCPPVAAAVSVTTFGAAATRYGIETIVVESRCADASLASIVRRLIIGDLPTSLWWADDLSQSAPGEALTSMARQVVYDSRTWRDTPAGLAAAARMLAGDAPPDVADLNWRRLTPLRAALASVVRDRDDVLRAGFEARILHRPGERALAELLGGWIAACMGWPDDRRAAIHEQPDEAVLRLTLTDTHGRAIEAAQADDRVTVTGRNGTSPIVLPIPQQSAADAVAVELATLFQDVGLRGALLALAARA